MTSQLSTVIGFEVRRVVRRRSFWAAALLIPVVMVAVVLIVTWSSNTASQNATAITQGSFEYSDASGLVQPDIATKFGGKPVGADPVARVKAGTLDAYIAYPADPAAQPTQVTAKDLGVIKNATYSTIASSVFAASVEAALDSPQTTAYIREGIKTEVTAYQGDTVAPGLGAVLPLALLAVLHFMIVALVGNQFLNATVEEKENRISEMMLVSLSASTLIRGKLVAIGIIGIIQVLAFFAAIAGIFGFITSQFGLDLSAIGAVSVDPIRMIIGVLILAASVMMTVSLLLTIGAAVPSAKEGAPFYSVVIVGTVIPMYLLGAILTDPDTPVVSIFTYLPPFSPMTALIRNSVGSLEAWQGLIVAAILAVVGAYMLRLGITLFERGVIQYGRKLSLREVFARPGR
ncbi:MAG: hypothetical protein B5766_03730 [Candidatus Lumbricidophila eiseniae]|uniref:ABC-2 type transporter transmembrane domain-containing protein n=1 Tax=Candidatus Lumbricidiphila eiseniae TaxID=1969409 RepID=A0A2A6FT58_9MICO|nr:MAG: hypothetical protein B5766_03730 [Candidatus Lumbricidophila eiseniae]